MENEISCAEGRGNNGKYEEVSQLSPSLECVSSSKRKKTEASGIHGSSRS